MASPPGPEWQRLAELLTARRVELNDAWRTRQQFCRDTGAEYRIVHDLENAKRTNYSGSTLALIERAYRWQPGSIRAVLDGGDPTPVEPAVRVYEASASVEPVTDAEHVDDELAKWIIDALRNGVDMREWNLNDPLEREIFTYDSATFNWQEKSGFLEKLRAHRELARERRRRENRDGSSTPTANGTPGTQA